MKKTLFIIIGIVFVAVIGWSVVSRENQAPAVDTSAKIASQDTANKVPQLSLSDYEGRTTALADFVGRPLVINSWAAWCPFCRKELVDFASAQKEFGDSVVIIAIDRAESLEVAKKYSDELGVSDDLVFLLDPEDAFYKAVGGFSMPETIFVGEDGAIRFHKRGPMDINEIRQRIEELLN